MRFVIVIIAIMFPLLANAQLKEVTFNNPGHQGLQTNYGIHTLENGHVWRLHNLDTWTNPGVIQRRKSLVDYGTNTVGLYGAHACMNNEKGYILYVGIRADTNYSGVGRYCVSDTFGLEIENDLEQSLVFPVKDKYHRWTQINDFLVHVDGVSIPSIFTTQMGVKLDQSSQDAIRFGPRIKSMGLEAPGQPRVQAYDTTLSEGAGLTGRYVYAFAYSGGHGIQSAIVDLNNEWTAITNLMPADSAIHGTDTLHILRKELDGLDKWYLAESVYRPQDNGIQALWIDSVGVDDSTTWYIGGSTLIGCDTCGELLHWSHLWNQYNYAGCGNISSEGHTYTDSVTGRYHFWLNGEDSTCADDPPLDYFKINRYSVQYYDSVVADFDSVVVDSSAIPLWTDTGGTIPGAPVKMGNGTADTLCRVAYAWYDPVTGIESPIGTPVECHYKTTGVDEGIDDTLYFTDNVKQGGARWIRIYQTVKHSDITGAEDTNVWRGALQTRIYPILDSGHTLVMAWADTAVANGLDSADVDGDNDYPYHFFRTAQGDVVMKPPYIYDCQIPFSDIAYVNQRMFGIGDPLAPEALYFSERNTQYTNMWSWPPLSYLNINEGVNGALVAIEPAVGFGRDAMYAFKRNAVYLIDFSSGQSVQLLEANKGAISRQGIVRYGKTVYFLSPDMRIYALQGRTVKDISDGIRDQIDSLFTNSSTASNNCRAFRLGENIKWFDTASGVGLSFNTQRGHWATESYKTDSGYVPRGAFVYDSSQGGWMSGSLESVTFSDSDTKLKKQSSNNVYYDCGSAGATPAYVRFPYVGDGKHLWSIEQVQISAHLAHNHNTFLRVLDAYSDTLSVDSTDGFYFTGGKFGAIIHHMKYATSKYLSLEIEMPNDGSYLHPNIINILDVKLYLRNRGIADVE